MTDENTTDDTTQGVADTSPEEGDNNPGTGNWIVTRGDGTTAGFTGEDAERNARGYAADVGGTVEEERA